MKRKHLILLGISYFLSAICLAQPSITWQRVYNGPFNSDDFAYDACQSTDGFFYLAGRTAGYGYVLKLNAYGDTVWTRIITAGVTEAVAPSDDGGCVLTAGLIDSARILKLNSNGTIGWQIAHGDGTVRCYDIIRANDGGYIACGRDIEGFLDYGYIVKIDSNHNLQWRRSYPSNILKVFRSIVESVNNTGYVLCGTAIDNSQDTAKAYMLKVNDSGNVVWERRFRIDNKWTSSINILSIPAGYLVGGTSGTASPDTARVFFVRTDTNGDIVFTKVFYNRAEAIRDINRTLDNRYVLSIMLFDTQTKDSTCKALITDSSGNIKRERVFTYGEFASFESIVPLNNGDILFAGEVEQGAFYDVYAARTDSLLNAPPIGIEPINNEIPGEFYLYQNYPNPFNSTTVILYELPVKSHVKLILYDVLGRELAVLVDEVKQAAIYEYVFNAENYSSGIYFLRFYTEENNFSRKIILIK